MDSEEEKKKSVFSSRLGEDELDRILNLKGFEDQKSPVGTCAARYRQLGWEISALAAGQASPLSVDFHQPQELWSGQLADFEDQGLEVRLGVHSGARSHLFVLEVIGEEGEARLDRLGHWQANVVAQRGDNRERHFYALPSGTSLPTAAIGGEAHIRVFGEGGWVLIPPSAESPADDPWRWLTPPWVTPPEPPQPALWQFLQEHLSEAAESQTQPDAAAPPWQEIYRQIAACPAVLQALLAPVESLEGYYDHLLKTALQEGFTDPTLLLGLLWHAPQGDALQNPERRDYLRDLVAAVVPGLGEGKAVLAMAPPLCPSGERVVVERHRYEAIRLELQRLSVTAAELERQVAEWDQGFQVESDSRDEQPAPPVDHGDDQPPDFLHDWTDLEHQVSALVEKFLPEDPETSPESYSAYQAGFFQGVGGAVKQQAEQSQQLDEEEDALQAFLKENPDLASDQSQVGMLNYCLKYYINFHPDLMVLPIQERLAKASRMAREFLGEPHKGRH